MIPELLGIAAGAASSYFQNQQAKQNDRINRERQLEDFKMMAEYNSPIQQMQRFKAAGLNPNLIYGKGDSGSISQMPGSAENKASLDPTIMSQMAAVASQIDLNKANKQKVIQEARAMKIENDIAEEAATGKQIPNTDYFHDVDARGRVISAKHSEYLTKAEKLISEVDNLAANNYKIQQEVENLKKQYELLDEQTKHEVVKRNISQLTQKITQVEEKLAQQGIFKGDEIWTRKMLQEMSPQELSLWNFTADVAKGGLLMALSRAGVPMDARKLK